MSITSESPEVLRLLERALNWASIDAMADTPDYVLAARLDQCPAIDELIELARRTA